ncbi:MAG: hypothetical protein UV58_C0004G0064 [Candidatus Wolfebacteria bacterium GW2011_GWC1_43_10]|uniref:GIY-YIG domain-containing protein n=2 Tax=Candidatus Wolfeibacteriota TaxID=1752735 RepID=A0A0G1EIN1_9BACT|nr:MAG: hypothetical protein UV58_C0004G0064 [Candidatus Wolfebacteria bacterium GW2011_GWC1_43_10]KKT22789.1 MAG: Excinuclease ABC C subunit domain protein [Parcubacteria group bacterium GW2011_GWB1_43_8b]OGM89687.1 MAG: hypothetical protein A2108_02725 [Candidatus Wolfebacteria bacterium GWA1_42_9]
MYFVYVIKNSKKGDLYVGYSNDVFRRLKEHQKKFPSDEIFYYEAYKFEKDARERERKLKQYGNAWRALKKRVKI